ncbi:hypothetical protein VNO77_13629 [Canavalia gladiata]|uniref:Uncharacterized protein n=1 Tax=Canavalia gladiata TaxID=3824 RepID=A0AAN9M2N6_CANGL
MLPSICTAAGDLSLFVFSPCFSALGSLRRPLVFAGRWTFAGAASRDVPSDRRLRYGDQRMVWRREKGASDSRPRDRGAVVSADLRCASPETGEADFSTSCDFAERLWFSLPPPRVLCFVLKHSPPCCNRFALQFRFIQSFSPRSISASSQDFSLSILHVFASTISLNQRKEEANLDDAAIAATGAAFLMQSCCGLGLGSSETRSAAGGGRNRRFGIEESKTHSEVARKNF